MTKLGDIFPLLKEIENDKLRDDVVKCWELAMHRGRWKNLEGIPFTLLLPQAGSFIDHVNRVTAMAYAVGNERNDVDMDLLIAGSLLHDVGKLLEYERKNGVVVKSKQGKIIRHPVSGAALAHAAGLNDKITSIIASHSKEGEFVERLPETIIVHHCDFIDFHIARGKQ